MNNPDVTVLLPVFNGDRHLRASIDSVLTQTFGNFELLIVNDGSTDGTARIIDSYTDQRVRVVTHPQNLGLSAALNHGMEVARGDFVARQDADDLSKPTRLERQWTFLRDHPSVALLGSQADAIDDSGRPLKPIDRSLDAFSIRWYALFDNPFVHTSVMFRRDVVWTELGGFRADYDPYSQDYELWGRLLQRHEPANLKDRLVVHRVHGSSIIGALGDLPPFDSYRLRFETIVRELVCRHAVDTFDTAALSDGEAALIPSYVLGVKAGELREFLAVFKKLLKLHRGRFPEAKPSSEFRRTLAKQYDAIAYRIVDGTRRDTISVYLTAIDQDPRLVVHLSWARALSLIVFGRRGRERLSQGGPARVIRSLRRSRGE